MQVPFWGWLKRTPYGVYRQAICICSLELGEALVPQRSGPRQDMLLYIYIYNHNHMCTYTHTHTSTWYIYNMQTHMHVNVHRTTIYIYIYIYSLYDVCGRAALQDVLLNERGLFSQSLGPNRCITEPNASQSLRYRLLCGSCLEPYVPWLAKNRHWELPCNRLEKLTSMFF